MGFERLLLVRLLSAVLLKKCLVLSPTGLQAQVLPYQPPRFQFVDVGETGQIVCTSSENYDDDGASVVWYKARENEVPLLIKSCSDGIDAGKFICKVKGRMLTLEIFHAQTSDSGIYLCAEKSPFGAMIFSNGSSSLVVGDSYTPSTRVTLLLPPPHPAHAGHIACVVHGVSNLVQVSWGVPGELQPEGLTRRVKNSSGLLTFVSILRIPRDPQQGGKNFSCEVRFNSSGPVIKKSTVSLASSSVDSDGKCRSYVVPTAVVGLLALLTLILSLLWIRLQPSRLGFRPRVHESPSSEVSQEEGLCYAQLDLPSRTSEGNQRNGAPRGKKRKA